MQAPMNAKKELQKLNKDLDINKNKLASAQARNQPEKISYFQGELNKTKAKISKIKQQQAKHNSSKGQSIMALPFKRPLSQTEQADMGKLKKSVHGLVIVHPLTAIGREIGLDVVTGFAPKKF